MPNVLSPRDLVFRPDNMDETVHVPTLLLRDKSVLLSSLRGGRGNGFKSVTSRSGVRRSTTKPLCSRFCSTAAVVTDAYFI